MLDKQGFEPSWLPALRVLIPVVCVLAAAFVLSMIGYMYYGARKMVFAIQGDQFVIDAPVYGRTLPRASLKLDQGRVGTLGEGADLRPVRRTGGMALGQVKLGRFRMEDGSDTFMYIHTGGKCLVIPTTEGYTLIMETAQPDQLLASLKAP